MLTEEMRKLAEILADTGTTALEAWRSGVVAVTQATNTRPGETMDFTNKEEDRWDRDGVENVRKMLKVERFLTEEGAKDQSRNAVAGWRAVMDWIDGSSNFATRQPDWSLSTAIEKNGVVVLGGIYCPARGELVVAGAGDGMYFLNTYGRTFYDIRYALQREMSPATVGRFALPQSKKRANPLELVRCYWHTGKRRNFELPPDDLWNTFPARLANPGCTFCCTAAMVQVALGKLDAAAVAFQNYWDFAAGRLLVAEAGGCFTALSRDYSRELTAADFAVANATKTPDGDEWLCHIFAARNKEILAAVLDHFTK